MTSKKDFGKDIEKYLEDKRKIRDEKLYEFLESFTFKFVIPLCFFLFVSITIYYLVWIFKSELFEYFSSKIGILTLGLIVGYLAKKKRWL